MLDMRMMGRRHRTYGHNVRYGGALTAAGALLSQNIFVAVGMRVGMKRYLAADSRTVRGVSWLYSPGRKGKRIRLAGPFSMHYPRTMRPEAVIWMLFFATACLLLVTQNTSFDIQSGAWMVLHVGLLAAG